MVYSPIFEILVVNELNVGFQVLYHTLSFFSQNLFILSILKLTKCFGNNIERRIKWDLRRKDEYLTIVYFLFIICKSLTELTPLHFVFLFFAVNM